MSVNVSEVESGRTFGQICRHEEIRQLDGSSNPCGTCDGRLSNLLVFHQKDIELR